MLTTPNAGGDVEQQELSFTVGGNIKYYGHFGRIYSLNIISQYDPALCSLVVSHISLKHIHITTCTWMLIEPLFTMAKT